MTKNLNSYQEAVCRWRPQDGNLRVTSGAGSGKTTTLVELVARLLRDGVPPTSIVVTTFTSKAAEEIKNRIAKRVGYAVDGLRVGTYHSLALQYFGKVQPWRFKDGANIDVPDGVVVPNVYGTLRTLRLWRLILTRGPVPGTGGTGLQINRADPFEYSGWAGRLGASELHPAVVLQGGTSLDDVTQLPQFTAAWSAFERAKKAIKAFDPKTGDLICTGVWDFADLLKAWNNTLRKNGTGILGRVSELGDAAAEFHGIHPWDPNKGTIVIVDEAQDNTPRQWKLSRRIATPYGRIVAVGDESQCVAAGEPIDLPDGSSVPVEDVRAGMEVLGVCRGRAASGVVTKHSCSGTKRVRTYTTESGHTFRLSAEHVVFAGLGPSKGYYVYLAWRRSHGFRLGMVNDVGAAGRDNVKIGAMRGGVDRMWMLGTYPTLEAARGVKAVLAGKHNITLTPFRKWNMDVVTSCSGGHDLLKALELDFERPSYFAKSSAAGGTTIRIFLGGSRHRSVYVTATFAALPPFVVKNFDAKMTDDGWVIRNSGSSLFAARQFAADLARVCGTYGIAAYVSERLSVPQGSTAWYATRAAGLVPGMLVPVRGGDGALFPSPIVDVGPPVEVECYDFEVAKLHTFFVGGVAVHNSIYAFRGAKPARFLDAAETLLAATLDLPVNYRSGRRIVALGNAIVADAEWRVGALTQAATEDLGEITWEVSETPDDEAYQLVLSVQRHLANGVPPEDIGVLCRTNTYAFRIAIMLGIYGIPVRPLGKRNLLAQPEVTAFVGWAKAVQENAVIPPAVLSSMLNLPQSYLTRNMRDVLAQTVMAEGIDAAIRRVRQSATKGYQKRSFDTMKRRIEDLRLHDWPDVCGAVGELVSSDGGSQRRQTRAQVAEVIEEFGSGTTDGDADGKGKGILVVLARLAEFYDSIESFAAQLARVDQQLRDDKVSNTPGVNVGTIHGCLSPKTWMQTDHGYHHIGQANSTGAVATAVGPLPYENRVTYDNCPMLRIRTKNGYEVEVTEDHTLMGWADTEYRLWPAGDLDVGVFLRLPLGERGPVAVPTPLPPAPTVAAQARRWTIPTEMSDDLALFLGLFVADGTLYNRGFRLTKQSIEVVEVFAALVTRIFGYPARVKPPTKGEIDWRCEVSSVFLSRWLRRVGGLEPHNKDVPVAVRSASVTARAAFLGGLFEDGTVNVKDERLDHVGFTTVRASVAALVQIMLLEQAIICDRKHVEHKYRDGTSRWTWRLTLPGVHGARFAKVCGFVSHHKIAAGALPPRPNTGHLVPVDRATMEQLPFIHAQGNTAVQNGQLNARNRGTLSRHVAQLLNDETGAYADELRFHHDRIESIERFTGPSMCVEVPGHGRFIQNGFDGGNSKGLEWPIVYGPGLSTGVFPSPMMRTKADEEEERRLLYVLVTRAAERLHLSSSAGIYRAGKLIGSGHSALVTEFIHPWLKDPVLADVYDARSVVPSARKAKVLEAVVAGAKVALDVGVNEGVRPALIAGTGAMVRELLTPDLSGDA